jgi:hypothetical protein
VEATREINEILQRIHFYDKTEKKSVVDLHSNEALFSKLLTLYRSGDCAYLEVTLPSWSHTVLYMDELYNDIGTDYIYPNKLVEKFKTDVGFNKAGGDVGLFDPVIS